MNVVLLVLLGLILANDGDAHPLRQAVYWALVAVLGYAAGWGIEALLSAWCSGDDFATWRYHRLAHRG